MDGGRGIGIVCEGDAVLALPGMGSTGNEFESLDALGPLAGIVEVVQARGELNHGVGLGASRTILGSNKSDLFECPFMGGSRRHRDLRRRVSRLGIPRLLRVRDERKPSKSKDP